MIVCLFYLRISDWCAYLFYSMNVWLCAYSIWERPTMYLLILLMDYLTCVPDYKLTCEHLCRLVLLANTWPCIYLFRSCVVSLTYTICVKYCPKLILFAGSVWLWGVSTNQTLHLKHSHAPFFTRNLIIAALSISCSAGTIQTFTMRRTCAKVWLRNVLTSFVPEEIPRREFNLFIQITTAAPKNTGSSSVRVIHYHHYLLTRTYIRRSTPAEYIFFLPAKEQ